MPSAFDATRHHRRSIRLRDHDYARAGAYFVTIVTQGGMPYFGAVSDGASVCNDAGLMVETLWQALPARFPHLVTDAFVVMPNHFHGILVIDDEGGTVGEEVPLGDIVGAFKSLTTREYGRGVRDHGWCRYVGSLWQRNYYEHIIRTDTAFERIRQYIADNPMNWNHDPENKQW